MEQSKKQKGDVEAALELLFSNQGVSEEYTPPLLQKEKDKQEKDKEKVIEIEKEKETIETINTEEKLEKSSSSDEDNEEKQKDSSEDVEPKEDKIIIPKEKTKEQIERELKAEAQNDIIRYGVGTGDDISDLDIDLTEEILYLKKFRELFQKNLK